MSSGGAFALKFSYKNVRIKQLIRRVLEDYNEIGGL